MVLDRVCWYETLRNKLGLQGPLWVLIWRIICLSRPKRFAVTSKPCENVILSIEIASEAIRKQDVGALFMDNRNQLVEGLANLLSRGVEDGKFRPQPAPQDTAHMILELVESAAYRCVLGGTPMRKVLPGLRDFVRAAVMTS